MKQIGVREFNSNISKYLKEAPIQIKKRHLIVATILPGEKKELPIVATSEPAEKKILKTESTNVATKKVVSSKHALKHALICEHGAMKGLCRKGCK